jgi:hypothetical protein
MLILSILVMEAILSSETSVFARVTRRNIQEDGILHSHRRDSLRSYITLLVYVVVQTFPFYLHHIEYDR